MESLPETLLQGLVRPVCPVASNEVDESLVIRAALLGEGGSKLTSRDVDCWQKVLTSRQYLNSLSDLRKAFANLIKKLCPGEL